MHDKKEEQIFDKEIIAYTLNFIRIATGKCENAKARNLINSLVHGSVKMLRFLLRRDAQPTPTRPIILRIRFGHRPQRWPSREDLSDPLTLGVLNSERRQNAARVGFSRIHRRQQLARVLRRTGRRCGRGPRRWLHRCAWRWLGKPLSWTQRLGQLELQQDGWPPGTAL